MRDKLRFLGLLAALVVMAALPLLAQDTPNAQDDDDDENEFMWVGRKGQGMGDGPRFQFVEQMKLTEEQQKKMQEMRVAHQKEMIPLRAQVKVKRIELQELFRGDANQGAINSKIDEISKLTADLQKKNAAHRLAMRNLLTPDQKKIWDSRPHRMGMMGDGQRGMMKHRGMGGDCPQGRGDGCRMGRGRGL